MKSVSVHVNRYYDEAYVEIPKDMEDFYLTDWDDIYYEDARINTDTDVDDTLENILKLESTSYTINQYIELNDVVNILQNPDLIFQNLILFISAFHRQNKPDY